MVDEPCPETFLGVDAVGGMLRQPLEQLIPFHDLIEPANSDSFRNSQSPG